MESVKEARRKGTLMAGTVDTWLVYVRFPFSIGSRRGGPKLTPPPPADFAAAHSN